MRSGVEGIHWKHGPPARDTSARAGVTAFGPGRWCDEHNLVDSAALGCKMAIRDRQIGNLGSATSADAVRAAGPLVTQRYKPPTFDTFPATPLRSPLPLRHHRPRRPWRLAGARRASRHARQSLAATAPDPGPADPNARTASGTSARTTSAIVGSASRTTSAPSRALEGSTCARSSTSLRDRVCANVPP